MSYQIVTDSSCDLPLDMIDAMGVRMVPLYVTFDGESYQKEKYDLDIRDFYERLMADKKLFPKSSLPSVQDYADVFTEYAKEGKDIICICITTKFSGSYNSACNAATIVKEEYPNVKIEVVDSIVNTVLQGILVKEVVRMRDNGLSFEDTLSNIERIKTTGRIIFTVGGVDYLKKGGRIGKVLISAVAVIGIKPLIILKEGEIFPGGITRNRKKSLQMVIDATKKHFADSGENPADYEFCIGYGYDLKEAEEFKENFLKADGEFLKINDIDIYQIGAAIGVHTGPLPLGIGLIKRYDA